MLKNSIVKTVLVLPAIVAAFSFGAVSTVPVQAQSQSQGQHRPPVYPSQVPDDGQSYRVHFSASVLRAHGHNELRVLGDDGNKYTVRAGFPLDNWSKGQRLHIVGFSVHQIVSANRVEPVS